MKIVHLSLDSSYNDNWGYQDNLLPKYQKKLGHDVVVITTNTVQNNGKIETVPCSRYFLDDGEEIIRLDYKNVGLYPFRLLRKKFDIYALLEEIKPDFIFSHGLLNYSFLQVIKYKKNINPNCIVVQDNHLDYNIGWQVNTLNDFIIRSYYRLLNRKTQKYVSKVYGVTPWRKKYAEDYFKINPKLTDVLIMGADDDFLKFDDKDKIRNEIRKKYDVKDIEFLIVTGGKIDSKKKIDLLIQSCADLNNVKLLIFGSISDEYQVYFNNLLKEKSNIIYIGWIASKEVYNYFFAADLVIFPGQHSVLWEQACASKVPCVFAKWEGMDHVDNGGNSELIDEITVNALSKKIEELLFTNKYFLMKEKAESSITNVYLYSNIAKKSLECAEKYD